MNITIEQVKKCRAIDACNVLCRHCIDFLILEHDRLTTELKAAHMHIDFLQEGRQEELKKAEEIAKRDTARECRKKIREIWGKECEPDCFGYCANAVANAITEEYGLEEE